MAALICTATSALIAMQTNNTGNAQPKVGTSSPWETKQDDICGNVKHPVTVAMLVTLSGFQRATLQNTLLDIHA